MPVGSPKHAQSGTLSGAVIGIAAAREEIRLSDLMVEPDVSAITIVAKRYVDRQVILEPGGVRHRNIGQKRSRYRRDLARGNHIIGKQRSSGTVGQAAIGVIKAQSRHAAEVSRS